MAFSRSAESAWSSTSDTALRCVADLSRARLAHALLAQTLVHRWLLDRCVLLSRHVVSSYDIGKRAWLTSSPARLRQRAPSGRMRTGPAGRLASQQRAPARADAPA